jgi:Fe-S cluster assembly protein SufD
MGINNRKSQFQVAMDEMAKKQLINVEGKDDQPNLLRADALKRYLQGENGKIRRTDQKNFPIEQFNVKREIAFFNSPEIINLENQQIEAEGTQAFSGVMDIGAEKISIWLHDNLSKEGVIFGFSQTPDSEIWNLLQEWTASIQAEVDDSMFDLSIGMFSQIFEIGIPNSVDLEKPLLIRVSINAGPIFLSQIIVFNLGDNAQAKIMLEIQSSSEPDNQNILPVVLYGKLGKNAKLDFIESQHAGNLDWYLPYEKIKIGHGASLNRLIMDMGGGFNKRYFSVDMTEKDGQAVITGVYLGNNEQQIICDTHQNHLASDTRTDLLFRGVLEGRSSALWKGNIFVAQGTQGVDGYQLNNHLLISETARAESIPGLEILSDEVKCSHGVTLSSINPDQLFYLQSRGMETESAVGLIKAGFIESAVARIGVGTFRQMAMDQIEIAGE